jgi:hypothetical protein
VSRSQSPVRSVQAKKSTCHHEHRHKSPEQPEKPSSVSVTPTTQSWSRLACTKMETISQEEAMQDCKEHLLYKCKALSSNPNAPRHKKKSGCDQEGFIQS